MMKVFTMFLTFIMSLLNFIGLSGTYTPLDEHYTDYEGVYITIEAIAEFEDSNVVDVVWHNETEETVCFGLGYTIEYLDGDTWVDVQLVDFAVPDIACMVYGGSTGTQSYRLKYFNMLRPGTYRIVTEFYLQDSDLGAQTAYATFGVKYL